MKLPWKDRRVRKGKSELYVDNWGVGYAAAVEDAVARIDLKHMAARRPGVSGQDLPMTHTVDQRFLHRRSS